MSPRTLTANFRGIEKMKHKAQEQANRDASPFAVVQHIVGGKVVVFIRPLGRALHMVEKHRQAEIVAELFPEVTP